MKLFYPIVLFLFAVQFSYSQNDAKDDSTSRALNDRVTAVEMVPQFPGGMQGFYLYLQKNLKYPEVAKLVGINGKLKMSFVIERDGAISDVTPVNCIGAGCESEAVKLLNNSPKWRPGIQNGRAVRVRYFVPINFSIEPRIVKMKELRDSEYGFVFNIKGELHTIDEAEKIMGRQFQSTSIDIAEPFFNYNKVEKFNMPGKKDIYLLIMKSS